MTARRLLVWLFSLFGLAGLNAGLSDASATTVPVLPDAIYQGFVPIETAPDQANLLDHPGTYSQVYNDVNKPTGSFEVSITLAGALSPYASAGVTGEESASGKLFYYFEIVGPGGATPVNLDVTASLSATSYGDGSAGAAMLIEQVSGVSFVYSSGGTACSNEFPCTVTGANWAVCSNNEGQAYCGVERKSLPLSTTEQLYANTIYVAELATSAEAPDPRVAYSATGEGAKGVADPHFAVDSSTPDAADYSLVFSSGIGNAANLTTPTVPEPATWILLVFGFAGTGLLRRSRSQRAPSVA
jgi:hypothetical protein